ncbi:MAG: hypothetical protein AB1481_05230 [Candidatus Omnitrophota bacterium]
MPKKFLFLLLCFLFIKDFCHAEAFTVLEKEEFQLSLSAYLRKDIVTFKNAVDLDSANSDDTSTYLGIDYHIAAALEFKEYGPKFFLKLERNGPFDYDAPLFVHNALNTSGGPIDRYRKRELLPQLEEFWLDIPLKQEIRLKAGLYMYEVGNGFALNGSFENYGLTFYRQLDNLTWRLYYCRPDFVHKNYHLSPHIPQDKAQGILYEPNTANFFAADVKFENEKLCLQPYIGALVDYTSSGKRSNSFSAPADKDILGTLGLAYNLKGDKFLFKTELARNFGKAESADPSFEDVYHTGYLLYTGIEHYAGKFTPSMQLLLASGNKVAIDAATNQDSTLSSGKNRAFSYYSPLNQNLGESISSSNADMLPIVAMGGGYGLNYGVPRPGTFSSGDFENLIMPCLGVDYKITNKLDLGLFAYYLRAFEKPVGPENAEGKFLSQDLGYELDLFVDYQLSENILISILGGYFFPGRYHKETRDDTSGSLFSPFVRGEGEADSAYQIELAVEFKF